MKGLAELETQLDELDGWGQLLIKDCIETDGEVVQHRVNELRYMLLIDSKPDDKFIFKHECLGTRTVSSILFYHLSQLQ